MTITSSAHKNRKRSHTSASPFNRNDKKKSKQLTLQQVINHTSTTTSTSASTRYQLIEWTCEACTYINKKACKPYRCGICHTVHAPTSTLESVLKIDIHVIDDDDGDDDKYKGGDNDTTSSSATVTSFDIAHHHCRLFVICPSISASSSAVNTLVAGISVNGFVALTPTLNEHDSKLSFLLKHF
jgi:hypothetical protein